MVAANVPNFTTVRVTGGIARSEIWNQIQADIYNRPVETVAQEEATALGCAMVAAVGAGIYADYEEAAKNMVRVTRCYEPNPDNVELYKDAYATWQSAFKGLHREGYAEIAAFQDKYRNRKK